MPNTNSTPNRPTPARRIATVEEYYFSRKLREIAQLRAAGADIVSLGIGGPDLPPAPEVIAALTADADTASACAGLALAEEKWFFGHRPEK